VVICCFDDQGFFQRNDFDPRLTVCRPKVLEKKSFRFGRNLYPVSAKQPTLGSILGCDFLLPK
jgi:hypothetical protein